MSGVSEGGSPGADSKPFTTSSWTERRLRAAIVSGQIRPGERLVLAALANRWDVSQTPLREAFQRLAADGLVNIEPLKGASAALLSRQELVELYEVRQLLEPHALERAMLNSTPEYRASILEAMESLPAVYNAKPFDRMAAEEKHRAFHLALISNCGSDWLMRISAVLFDHSVRYWVQSTQTRGGPEAVTMEHGALADAVVSGDIAIAVDMLREHLNLTVDVVTESQGWSD